MSIFEILSSFSPWWQLTLALVSLSVFGWSLKKGRAGQFYSDTFAFSWLGIFVWGDGLILGPFWLISAGLFLMISPIAVIRYLLLFYAIRFAYEVIYWINHQVANRSYSPPFFRNVAWLKPSEAAILYQLLTTCVFLLAMFGLVMSFT